MPPTLPPKASISPFSKLLYKHLSLHSPMSKPTFGSPLDYRILNLNLQSSLPSTHSPLLPPPSNPLSSIAVVK